MTKKNRLALSRVLAGLVPLIALTASPALEAARPANDDFGSRISLSGSSGKAQGTNVGATRETGEPDHAANRPIRSVWWS